MAGRPRTAIGTCGTITVRRRNGRAIAETRTRDADGRMRQVRVRAKSAAQARSRLKQRLLNRPRFAGGGVLRADSSFAELAELWLADLELRDLAEGTKQHYRDQLRLHVRPALEHYTLGEITTGRVEWFLKSQSAISYSRGRQSRTPLLNLLFAFALRHDAIARNPVEGTSQLRKPKGTPQALTSAQIAAIRAAAATWRTASGLPGPRSDGQVRDIIEVLLGTAMRPGEVLALRSRDIIEVLLGTAMRPGEVLALRSRDIIEGPDGLVVQVSGTVVQRKGSGTLTGPRQDPGVHSVHPGATLRGRRAASPAGRDA